MLLNNVIKYEKADIKIKISNEIDNKMLDNFDERIRLKYLLLNKVDCVLVLINCILLNRSFLLEIGYKISSEFKVEVQQRSDIVE